MSFHEEAQVVATQTPSAGIGGHEDTPEVTTAPSPFDNQYKDADIVLRTVDGTDFYVHSSILRMSSTFFQAMLSLPQPTGHDRGRPLNSGAALEVLPVPERSKTLESVLRLCYPKAIHNPGYSTVLQISPMLAVAQKYDMEQIMRKLTKKLHTLRHHRPLEVFAEAFYRDLDDIARDAADAFCYPTLPPSEGKKMPTYTIDKYSPHMDDIPASWYFRLLEHHDKVAAIRNPRRATIPRFSLPPRSSTVTDHGVLGQQRSGSTLPLHPFSSDPRADLLVRSSDGSEFFVWASFLRYSSPVLERMVASATPAPAVDETHPFLARQLDLPEDGQTIALLLQLCYPQGDPDLASGSLAEMLVDFNRLLDAARKYQVPRAVEFVRQKLAVVPPMRAYFIALQQGWEDGLQEAAVRCVYELADEYVPEMELGTAAAYRRLLVYRQECRGAIIAGCTPTPAPYQVQRLSHARYFNKQSWLPRPSESRLWLAIHRRVRENVYAARDPAFGLEALHTSFSQAGPAQQVDTNIGSLETILDVARELAKVRRLEKCPRVTSMTFCHRWNSNSSCFVVC